MLWQDGWVDRRFFNRTRQNSTRKRRLFDVKVATARKHERDKSRSFLMPYQKYLCLLCGYIYDEELGCPEEGIAPGTRWEEIPEDWTCSDCGAMKSDFEIISSN